ncbi:MAG: PolC-type DNA polymerase III [Christensenellaceae bacterium]|jgi:DNA polymerase-3 subunit alpha (Gram-positive type)|nr:PolC-type DNA polymerase III [Christensenellaceae bacterium]
MEAGLEDIFAQSGVPNARLLGAKLNKEKKTLLVTVQVGSLLRARCMEDIRQRLADTVEGLSVELHFEFTEAALSAVEQNDPAALDALRDSWGDTMPIVRQAINGSLWRYEAGVVQVLCPQERVGLIGARAVQAAQDYYSAAYGLQLRLDVQGDARLTPAAAKAAEPKAAKGAKAKATHAPKAADTPRAGVIYGTALRRAAILKQSQVGEEMGAVTVSGEILSIEVTKRKGGGPIVTFVISDHTNTMPCKLFLKPEEDKIIAQIEAVKKRGDWLAVQGNYSMDNWLKRMCISPRSVGSFAPPRREDTAGQKRVELHLHTQMSSMDGLTKVKEAIDTAARWGHKALAITDHGVVHAFPEAVAKADSLAKAGKEIKVLLGVEGYLLPDCALIDRPRRYVAASITSGAAFKLDDIFEIAAVRFDESGVLDTLSLTVDSGAVLPDAVAARTGLTQARLAAGVPLKEALEAWLAFVGEDVQIWHEAAQLHTLRAYADRFSLPVRAQYINTQTLSHYLRRELKQTALADCLAAVTPDGAPLHSAADTALGTAKLFLKLLPDMAARGALQLPLFDAAQELPAHGKKQPTYHIILLAQNHAGLVNLYRLVSYAHLEHLKKVPRIPRSLLTLHREGLIVGTACEAGELFRAVIAGKSEETLREIAGMYDYLEIQPTGNNQFLVRNGTIPDEEGLRELNRRIVGLGEAVHKPVVATGDVHFLEPDDALFRSIIMHARGFDDAEEQAPLYFKTTDEMLREFCYLGEEKAREVVVDNPNAIAARCERLKPFLSEKSTYAPTLPDADEELTDMAYACAHALYGKVLPPLVQARLDKELNSIVGNGYASLYLMAQRLVQKSLSDGYLVGSRGSVGSSFVANMAGITEVNALQPHYVCPACQHSEFEVDREKYACGVDMPDKACPHCGAPYLKLGYEIPFETFLGFEGDKTPDIDLNFSGEYQAVAHKFTEVMFGEGHAFRAGTISGIKDKTAYGYVRAYCEANGILAGKDEIDRLVSGCAGVKKTTGQHPGGIVIVPAENDIMEFTPIQHPADKTDGSIITTHFDFHAMDDRLVKLDILGHDDPTALRMLQDITGLNPITIPLDDPETLRIFSGVEPLGCTLKELDCEVGSIGIPEFGTSFVRQMLMDTRPTTMEELVRISGLSHGTDVWVGNAQDLVRGGTATLGEVICCRDDIMRYLIMRGADSSISFKTMESVRKGRGLTPEMEAAMHAVKTPQWFIDSCKKIKYMFPRAHAAAYVMMAFRVAYYKVHLPLAFYAVYYTVRADAFDIAAAYGGAETVLNHIRQLKKKGTDIEPKEADLLVILEVVFEMNKRGIELLPVDLYKSASREFRIEEGRLRPPFSAVAGVGANAADGIAKASRQGAYTSVEDFRTRSGANSAVVKSLQELGVLEGLPETNQLSLF